MLSIGKNETAEQGKHPEGDWNKHAGWEEYIKDNQHALAVQFHKDLLQGLRASEMSDPALEAAVEKDILDTDCPYTAKAAPARRRI